MQPWIGHDGARHQVVSNDNIFHDGGLKNVCQIAGNSSSVPSNWSPRSSDHPVVLPQIITLFRYKSALFVLVKNSEGGKHLGVCIDGFMCPCPSHCSSSLQSIHEVMKIFFLLSTYCALEPHLQQTLIIHPFTIQKLPQDFTVMLLRWERDHDDHIRYPMTWEHYVT